MKFRKKVIEIEAIQYRRELPMEVIAFCTQDDVHYALWSPDGQDLFIRTLDGFSLRVRPNDWIIRVNDEFYPINPEIFEASYEAVEE